MLWFTLAIKIIFEPTLLMIIISAYTILFVIDAH